MIRPARNRAAPRPALSRWLGLVALLAFFLQGLAVQTHIHGTPANALHGAQVSIPAPAEKLDPLAPANCPLCQESLHAGAAVTPVAPALSVLLNWVAAAPAIAFAPAAAFALRHGWQSRAPPRN